MKVNTTGQRRRASGSAPSRTFHGTQQPVGVPTVRRRAGLPVTAAVIPVFLPGAAEASAPARPSRNVAPLPAQPDAAAHSFLSVLCSAVRLTAARQLPHVLVVGVSR